MSTIFVFGVIAGIIFLLWIGSKIIERLITKRDMESWWVADDNPYLIVKRIGKAMEQEKKKEQEMTKKAT